MYLFEARYPMIVDENSMRSRKNYMNFSWKMYNVMMCTYDNESYIRSNSLGLSCIFFVLFCFLLFSFFLFFIYLVRPVYQITIITIFRQFRLRIDSCAQSWNETSKDEIKISWCVLQFFRVHSLSHDLRQSANFTCNYSG